MSDPSQVKRCLVCGVRYELGEEAGCRVARRHIATDTPGTVYVLCFGEPTYVASAPRGLPQPMLHYVGWTGKSPPERRVREHNVPVESIVSLTPGTAEDEHRLMLTGNCPSCGAGLRPKRPS